MLPEHLLTFRAWLTRLQTATRNQQGTAKQRQMPELEAACASQLETLDLVIREYERTVLRQEPLAVCREPCETDIADPCLPACDWRPWHERITDPIQDALVALTDSYESPHLEASRARELIALRAELIAWTERLAEVRDRDAKDRTSSSDSHV